MIVYLSTVHSDACFRTSFVVSCTKDSKPLYVRPGEECACTTEPNF